MRFSATRHQPSKGACFLYSVPQTVAEVYRLFPCCPQPSNSTKSIIHPSSDPVHHHSSLSLPHPLDCLRNTDIIRLELVQTNADRQRCEVEKPHEGLVKTGEAVLGDVVDDDGLETDVGVKEDGAAEDGVHGRVERAGSEGGD